MPKTYAELIFDVEATLENTLSDTTRSSIVQRAEQKIYNLVQFPELRKTQTTNLVEDNRFLALPDDFLYVHSFSLVDAAGNANFLLDKDVNFIREAYPSITSTSQPRHYALYNDNTLLIGPTPNADYVVELTYGHYPESIVTAGTTWLSTNFDTILFEATLVEGARQLHMRKERVDEYNKQFMSSLGQFKQFGDGKLRRDSYRSGQVRVPVS